MRGSCDVRPAGARRGSGARQATGRAAAGRAALLARLALSPGRVVSVDALTDALWGEDLPADAANALQIRVSKLRRALVAAGVPGDVLLTRAPGYLLAVEPDAIDVHRFERLLTAARAGRPDGSRGRPGR